MRAWVMIAVAAATLWAADAEASWFESLVMPGDLAAKHAQLERDCAKCHQPFDKAAQTSRCLSCHTEVDADLKAERGYHGREPSVRGRECKSCHSDHLGSNAQIVNFDRDTFTHTSTDMPLLGSHARVACEQCHGKARYRDAPSLCADCHAPDPHEGCLGILCTDCHSEEGWTKVRFDHDASAFPLVDRHRKVPCAGCHASRKFKPTPTDCRSCHAKDDRHRGRLGTECQSCHSPRKWAETRFEHRRDTGFQLLGAHARTACDKCHENGIEHGRTPTTCYGCHQRDDGHNGQFGRACETCHTPLDWRRSTFDHDRDTHFRLRGHHRETHCVSCHRGNPHEERLATSCSSCHERDDVHHGREGSRCESCHDEKGWRRDVIFDHDTTRFPLSGGHAHVACTDCHTSPSFKEVGRECVSCHEKDDVHHGREGSDCERCHDVSTFKAVHRRQ